MQHRCQTHRRTQQSSSGTGLLGLYSVMPVQPVPGLSADLYYLGLDRRNAAFDSGVANQTVHSVGTRLWGQAGAWDYNTEGVFQFGSFGARDIRAWTIASNTGYTTGSLWGQPRLGPQGFLSSIPEIRLFHRGPDQRANQHG